MRLLENTVTDNQFFLFLPSFLQLFSHYPIGFSLYVGPVGVDICMFSIHVGVISKLWRLKQDLPFISSTVQTLK